MRIGNYKRLDIVPGTRYNSLTVISEAERYELPSGQTNRAFNCKCDCGNEKVIRLLHLVRGRIKTCGCFNERHGASNTLLYGVWRGMIDRCTLPSNIGYQNYGGRGIKVCNAWLNSFMAFQAFAMSNGYDRGMTLDRIDSNGNYEPENCRFVPPVVNCNNRSVTFMVNYHGKRIAFTDLMRDKGIDESHWATIRGRISRGWDHSKAVDTKIRVGNYRHGKRYSSAS